MIKFNPKFLSDTDIFYNKKKGFNYDFDKSIDWLEKNLEPLPNKGNVLDLCCGDGFWSACLFKINENLNYHGIDISEGAIKKSHLLMPEFAKNFLVGDVEEKLPWEENYFDYIFARGPGVFNQHSMGHNGAVQCIQMWHEYLKDNGRFCGIFSSNPELIGTYTPVDKVVLPFNKEPRQTKATIFDGGKYHHSIESFLEPFWKASKVKILNYKFIRNNHIVLTKKIKK